MYKTDNRLRTLTLSATYKELAFEFLHANNTLGHENGLITTIQYSMFHHTLTLHQVLVSPFSTFSKKLPCKR